MATGTGLMAPYDRRLSTGIAGLDTVLGGGVMTGGISIVQGAPGAGKTSFGLHFIAGPTAKAPGVIFGFYKDAAALVDKGDAMGLGQRAAVASSAVIVKVQTPDDKPLDALGLELLDMVRKHRASRVFIDDFAAFRAAAVDPSRFSAFFSALIDELRRLDATVVYSIELAGYRGDTVEIPVDDLSRLTENLVLMQYREAHRSIHRVISTVKMRNSGFHPAEFRFGISDEGLEVSANNDTSRDPNRGARRSRQGEAVGDGET